MRSALFAVAFASSCLAAPCALASNDAATTVSSGTDGLCFIIGDTTLPAETQDAADALADVITCSTTTTTLDNVPDVTSGGISFSQINFADSSKSTLQFALDEFATSSPLADNDLATFQNELNTYLATEAGIRSVGGSLAIKVPKFFLEFQVSRIQTAQGNPPTNPSLAVDHLLQKVLTNAAGQSQSLLDEVTKLSTILS